MHLHREARRRSGHPWRRDAEADILESLPSTASLGICHVSCVRLKQRMADTARMLSRKCLLTLQEDAVEMAVKVVEKLEVRMGCAGGVRRWWRVCQ